MSKTLYRGEVEISGVCSTTNTAGLRDSRSFRNAATSGATHTVAAAGALAINTHYTVNLAGATAFTLASAADSPIGSWITLLYGTAIGNGVAHSYTCADDTWSVGSLIFRCGGAVANQADLSVDGDNVVTIQGVTNGDGGVGTTVKFVNTTGEAGGWAVEATVWGQGTQATAKDAGTVFA